jgi:tetratricopeptide (TPR) repeat protein
VSDPCPAFAAHSWGWRNVDSWTAGIYRVNLFVDGQRVATGAFTIFRPSADAAMAFERGIRLKTAKQYREAIAYFDRAIRLDPEYSRAYTNRCFLYIVLDEFERALSDCNRSLALNPSDFRALYDRGTVHVATKQYDKAIADLSVAVAKAPRFGDAYGNRAVAYYGKGDHERAWQDVHKAQQLGHEMPASFLDKLRRASGRSR